MATLQATQTETNYRLADPEEVRKILENYPSGTSLEALPGATPQPALNGKRIMLEKGSAIFFVWAGSKCLIPDAETYNAVFSGLDIIVLGPTEFNSITLGDALTSGAAIVRGQGQVPNYFVSNNHKHYVTSPKVMSYCHFRGPLEIPRAVVEAIPRGFDIDYGA